MGHKKMCTGFENYKYLKQNICIDTEPYSKIAKLSIRMIFEHWLPLGRKEIENDMRV